MTYGCHNVWQFYQSGRSRSRRLDTVGARPRFPAPGTCCISAGSCCHGPFRIASRIRRCSSAPAAPTRHTRAPPAVNVRVRYLPTGEPVTVDWKDPVRRDGVVVRSAHGVVKAVGTFVNRSTRRFAPPGSRAAVDDWVLVLDDTGTRTRRQRIARRPCPAADARVPSPPPARHDRSRAVVSSAAFVITRIAAANATAVELSAARPRGDAAAHARAGARSTDPVAVGIVARPASSDSTSAHSSYYNSPVAPIVGERARNTALLATMAFLVALALGIPPAFVTATRPGSLAARVIRATSLLLLSLPSFVSSLGSGLDRRANRMAAGRRTRLEHRRRDVRRAGARRGVAPAAPGSRARAAARRDVRAPAGAGARRRAGAAARCARRAPGDSRARTIVWRHAGRLAIKPVAGVGGLAFGALLSGSFAVEAVTAWPGLGRLTIDALRYRDLYLVAGCAAAGTLVLALGTADRRPRHRLERPACPR